MLNNAFIITCFIILTVSVVILSLYAVEFLHFLRDDKEKRRQQVAARVIDRIIEYHHSISGIEGYQELRPIDLDTKFEELANENVINMADFKTHHATNKQNEDEVD